MSSFMFTFLVNCMGLNNQLCCSVRSICLLVSPSVGQLVGHTLLSCRLEAAIHQCICPNTWLANFMTAPGHPHAT